MFPDYSFAGNPGITVYPPYTLNSRQLLRVEQAKYFNAIKVGIREIYGVNTLFVCQDREFFLLLMDTKTSFNAGVKTTV